MKVVDIILALQRYFDAHPAHRTARDTVLLEFLENLNDALVRELYTPTNSTPAAPLWSPHHRGSPPSPK